jgi:hypothetical protein
MNALYVRRITNPLYRIWRGMVGRCTNPRRKDYARYGGRGVEVCARWLRFENFVADMAPKPAHEFQVDRIDNNGPYSPENCRWATPEQQARNRRDLVEFRGERLTRVEWAERTGIDKDRIGQRLRYGWSVERALTESPHDTGARVARRGNK